MQMFRRAITDQPSALERIDHKLEHLVFIRGDQGQIEIFLISELIENKGLRGGESGFHLLFEQCL